MRRESTDDVCGPSYCSQVSPGFTVSLAWSLNVKHYFMDGKEIWYVKRKIKANYTKFSVSKTDYTSSTIIVSDLVETFLG